VTPDRQKQAQEKAAADAGPAAPKLSFYLGYIAKRVILKPHGRAFPRPIPAPSKRLKRKASERVLEAFGFSWFLRRRGN
jgi:hypothetical protein